MRVKITDLVLRDAHQSLLATRMRTEDMLPIAPLMDEIGYWSVEMWGGATFDTCLQVPEGGPLGAHHPAEEGDAEHPLPDAAARAEHRRVQALLGRHPGEVHREGVREGHRGVPHIRRAERHQEHADRHAHREALRGHRGGFHLLHHLAGP